MFFAIDPFSGAEVPAHAARARLIYRCPICGSRVKVRRGFERAVHFAHLSGAADPNCENYTPSRFEYRRRPPGEGRMIGPGITTSFLSFSMSTDGPRLAYWLPPAPGASWSGAVEVEAFETSRAFRASNLGSGQRIEFPLVDGQWDVRDTGDVADEYLGLLARGRQSLDASGSVFDASTTVGRQILPGQSVAYGQSLHWVSRVALDSNARGVRLCAVEKLALTNGWHVHKVQLPEVTYSGDEFMELVQWLERRIRPARPKAWIELPWPRATTEVGFAVYDPADGVLVVRADRLVDIRLADAVTGQNLFERISQQNVNIEGLQTGTYDLFINDTHHETFVVEPETSVGSAAVLVRVAGQVPVALAYVQPMLDALIASGKRSVDLQLTWGHPAVGTIVSLDGRTFGQKGEGGVAVLFSPGMRLDAANLGSLQWTPDRIVATDPSFPLSSRLRERANWLLSVASMENVVQGERVVVPNALRADAVFQRLAMASWRVELGPQVRDMSRSLSEWR